MPRALPTPSRVKLSLIIPMYNEIDIAQECLEDSQKHLESISDSYEIVVAEDGSIDGTREFLQKAARKNPHVRCTCSKARLGKGQAIVNAIKMSRGDIVAVVDADRVGDSSSLRVFMKKARETDGMVVGSRVLGGTADRRPLPRRIGSKAYNRIVRFLFGDDIQDHQCGFKALTREIVNAVTPYLREKGFAWDTEFIALARRFGYDVVEMPITSMEHRNGSESTVRLLRDGASMARSIVRIKSRVVSLPRMNSTKRARPGRRSLQSRRLQLDTRSENRT